MDIYGKESVSIDVGQRLKHLREERGVSMRSLARTSGLSANALSMIERGLTSPSVSTLNKLAGALEVPVTAFFRAEPDRTKIVHLKFDDRIRVPFAHSIWEGLGGEQFSGRIEAFMVTLEPGSSSGPHGMLHTGSEFVYCLQGVIDYEVDGQVYQLNTGDTVIFAAQLTHRWRNSGSTPAKAIIVISCFEEGERPGEYHTASVGSGQSPDGSKGK